MKKLRNGKYHDYEKRILQFLVQQKESVSATTIRFNTKIPKSSFYEVLGNLRISGNIEWLGEPQDWISMVLITPKGQNYLKFHFSFQ